MPAKRSVCMEIYAFLKWEMDRDILIAAHFGLLTIAKSCLAMYNG